MKKMIPLLLSAFLCFSVFTVFASAEYAEDEMIRSWHICNSVETAYWHGILTTAVLKTATVKDQTVAVGRNESLIVPKNVTLVLKRGARIDGTVYIHKGGKLRITDGNLSVSPSGAVISDGTLSIGKKAEFTVENGGEVFIGKTGRFILTSEENLRFADMATVVCVGKTNAKNEKIGKNLIAVYVTKNGETTLSEDPEAELPNAEMYDLDFYISDPSTINYFFDNGVCFRAIRDPWYDYIGKVRICTAVGYTFDYLLEKNRDLNPPGVGTHYCEVEIVEIDGEDCWLGDDGYEPVPILPVSSELVDPYAA